MSQHSFRWFRFGFRCKSCPCIFVPKFLNPHFLGTNVKHIGYIFSSLSFKSSSTPQCTHTSGFFFPCQNSGRKCHLHTWYSFSHTLDIFSSHFHHIHQCPEKLPHMCKKDHLKTQNFSILNPAKFLFTV